MIQTAPRRFRALPLCVLSLLASLTVAAPAVMARPSSLELIQTISLKGAPGRLDHLAIDTKGGRLFVANLSNNSLDIVELKAGKLVKQIPHQQKIHGVAHDPEMERIFAGNGGDGVVNVFDGRTYRLIHSLKFADANNVRYDSRTKQVYVGHADKALSAIDARTLKVKATIKLPGPPKAFQIESARSRLYVNTHSPSQVVVVDIQKNEVAARFPLTLTEANFSLALDFTGGRVFVGSRKKPSILVLDMKTGKEIASVSISGDIDDLFYDAKRRRLYASCGEGFLAIVGVKENDRYQLIERIASAKEARTSFFDPSSGRLYVGVPRQAGKEGPEIWVYRPRP
jgi:DNA-binding beta-propeller fold protein YncE